MRFGRFWLIAVILMMGAVGLYASGQAQVVKPGLPPNTYKVVWVFNASEAQKLVDQDPSVIGSELPWRVTPLFQIQLAKNYQSLSLSPEPHAPQIWRAEVVLPLSLPDRTLPPQRFYLTPLPDAGSRARQVIALLQKLWARASPFLLILDAPAFDQPGLDPRYNQSTRTLTIKFP